MEITPYHPFKSKKAKERYLTFYDTEAKKWPVDSETKVLFKLDNNIPHPRREEEEN